MNSSINQVGSIVGRLDVWYNQIGNKHWYWLTKNDDLKPICSILLLEKRSFYIAKSPIIDLEYKHKGLATTLLQYIIRNERKKVISDCSKESISLWLNLSTRNEVKVLNLETNELHDIDTRINDNLVYIMPITLLTNENTNVFNYKTSLCQPYIHYKEGP